MCIRDRIYLSFVESARKEISEEINENGLNNSQIKILALLMRLRQICCHPGLFLQNYSGESSKLNQCIEIVVDAIKSCLLYTSTGINAKGNKENQNIVDNTMAKGRLPQTGEKNWIFGIMFALFSICIAYKVYTNKIK